MKQQWSFLFMSCVFRTQMVIQPKFFIIPMLRMDGAFHWLTSIDSGSHLPNPHLGSLFKSNSLIVEHHLIQISESGIRQQYSRGMMKAYDNYYHLIPHKVNYRLTSLR